MTFLEIEAFLKIAQCGSFSAAAEKLYITQPALGRRIRALEQERREHVYIYAMTAQASSESEQQCLEAGMDGHIAKPIEAEELVKTILTVTGKEVSDTR